jgi:ribosomal protein L13E
LNQTTTDTNTQAQPAATQQAATQQAATQPAATPKDLIRQIQTVLKTKYNANLGKFGAKGDGIDEKWGNLTQTALENALKSIADVKQRRETETQQTTTQDTAIQQAAEKGRMEVPQTNNLPNLPGIQQKQDIYTTLVNNKTLLTRNQNTVIYNGPDLSSAQRNELEQSMSQKGYRISKDNRDFRSGDKIIFKKN